MAEPRSTRTHARSGAHIATWAVVTVLLAAALVATLWVPFYNRLTPRLGGFPFFYWYQLLWVPIVAVLALLAYLLSRSVRGPAARERTGAPGARDTGSGAPGETGAR